MSAEPFVPGARPLRLPQLVASIGARLPQYPHSVALAIGLNLALKPRLSAESAAHLRGRPIGIRIEDIGVDLRVRLSDWGFIPLSTDIAPAVCFTASAFDFYLMARRLEDPDTLFFNRRLRIDGDTELGLVVKNALDSVDWLALPPALRALVERGSSAFSALRDARKPETRG